MASLASVNIKFTADLKSFSTEMQNSLRQIDKAGQQFQKIGQSMATYVTLPLLAAAGASIKFASDYNESLNKVDVAFKSSSGEVKNFAKTSLESFGIAESTALDMSAVYGDMATGMGLTTGEAAKMSKSLVGLAGDLSSFKNVGIEQANTALVGIFSGETESLKKLGFIMTEANLQAFALTKGIRTQVKDMDQASKVNLRYAYILSVTKNAQGDFARTQGGASNQIRIFQESLKQVGQQLGAVILPLFTKIVTIVNEKIKAFSALSEGTKTVIVVVAGLVAVVGPLLLGLGAIAAVVPTIVAGFALISGAIVPVLAGATLLYGVFLLFSNGAKQANNAVVELTENQKALNKINESAASIISGQKANLESLLVVARDENASKKERLKAIEDINKISPEYLGNINLESINTDKARLSIEKYTSALALAGKAQAAKNLLQSNYNEQAKIELAYTQNATENWEKLKKAQNNRDKNGNLSELSKVYFEISESENKALEIKNKKLNPLKKEEEIALSIFSQYQKNLSLLEGIGEQQYKNTGEAAKGEKIFDNGTVAFYEKQIALLKTQQSQVVKTGAEYYLLGNEIAAVEEKINKITLARIEPMDLKSIIPDFEPTELIKTVETTEQMMARLAASVSGASASIVNDQNRIKEVGELLSVSVSESFGALGNSMVASLGLASTGLQGFAATMLQTLVSLIQMVVKQIVVNQALAMSNAITGATSSGVATGPGAIFTTPAFIATAIGGVLAAFASIPKFATGGVIGGNSLYGDKILARVNSGELVLNSQQQSRLYGMITPNSGGAVNVTLGGGFELDGNKLRLVLDRTDARNNRTR